MHKKSPVFNHILVGFSIGNKMIDDNKEQPQAVIRRTDIMVNRKRTPPQKKKTKKNKKQTKPNNGRQNAT